ncbi:MAG: S1C family serine protease [Candidatus Uhrbacteria bacterium]
MKTFSLPSILLIAAALGAGAGIIGTVGTQIYLSNYSVSLENFAGPINLTGEHEFKEPQNFNEAINLVQENLLPASVEIFARTSSGLYEPGQGQASGFFITSDGWLVTANSKFISSQVTSLVVVVNNQIFLVEKTLVDQATKITFLKINASNLPVVSLSNFVLPQPGDNLFITPASDSLISSSLLRLVDINDQSRAAESTGRRFLLNDSFDTKLAGSAVANSFGEVVGILLPETSGTSSTVLPLTAIRPAIYSLLKEGQIKTFLFGANVTNIQKAVGLPESETRGHWYGEIMESVLADGPAASAGLKKDDIILDVGGVALAGFFLDELLADYHPGETVSLTIDRAGVEQKVEVVLGTR